MPNPFVKLWKYLTASANDQIDQRADPKIQIQQAIEAEQPGQAGADGHERRGRHPASLPGARRRRPPSSRGNGCPPAPTLVREDSR